MQSPPDGRTRSRRNILLSLGGLAAVGAGSLVWPRWAAADVDPSTASVNDSASSAALTRPIIKRVPGVWQGLDYSWAHPELGAVTAGGYTFVCRYLSDTAAKNLSPAEVADLHGAGLRIISNWEAGASAALNGRAQGVTDATKALAQADACGMPSTRPVFFSVDFNATAGQQPAINDYFDGVASVTGLHRCGAYGGYAAIKALFDAGKILWGWQTYAWSAGNWEPRAWLRQVHNGITVGGAACDLDQAINADFGQW